MEKIKLVYIVGRGHSGSTLLDLILGSHSNVISVGEVSPKAMQRLFTGKSNKPCTCGEEVVNCEFWNDVRSKFRGSSNEIKKLISEGREEENRQFIESVLSVSGKGTYLESTKNVNRLKMLFESEYFDLYPIVIFRDPRAVALSEARRGQKYLDALRRWCSTYDSIENLMRARRVNYCEVRYEDLVQYPSEVIKEIMNFIGEEYESEQLDFSKFQHHNLDGNAMRFRNGSKIIPDFCYLKEIDSIKWIIGTIICFKHIKQRYSVIRRKFRMGISKKYRSPAHWVKIVRSDG